MVIDKHQFSAGVTKIIKDTNFNNRINGIVQSIIDNYSLLERKEIRKQLKRNDKPCKECNGAGEIYCIEDQTTILCQKCLGKGCK